MFARYIKNIFEIPFIGLFVTCTNQENGSLNFWPFPRREKSIWWI